MADDPDSSSREGVRTDPDSAAGGGTGLTDAQLRASAVAVDVSDRVGRLLGETSLSAATLAALETIELGATTLAALETIQIGSIPAVALDAATLAALETTELGATTLAALETIQIGSLPAVALDAATLAALETIELGATTLAALESITVVDGGGSLTIDSPQLPAALAAGGGIKVEGVAGGVSQPVDTELPAAAALADAAGNPTTPMVGAASLLFNGSNWDRVRGDTTNGVDVDVTRLPNAATPSQSSVSSSATTVTVLASNSSRKGATVYNDSTQVLYLKLGATASTTSYTVQIAAAGYFEIPFGYTGIIDGIWASANGSARVTELT